MSNLKSKLKTYNEIANFSEIARRYFINNFYDGALTILGILLGFFVVVLKDPSQPSVESSYIILPGIGTAISMLISGISGSYLSERAEQKKIHADLDKAMAKIDEEDFKKEVDIKKEEEELKKAMLKSVKLDRNTKAKKKKKLKTIYNKAESFANKVVASVNGGAPFLGGIIPLIPFLLVTKANIFTFFFSFLIIFICIVFLGIYLGKISKESIYKNIFQMLFAFILTMLIVTLFLG